MARVLVVDDAAFQRMRASRALTEKGYDVEEAENGQEAVDKYQAAKPDVVLMDITMPVMDGIAATREITRLDPSARVVILSALGQQRMVMEAIQAGAKDFLVKPFEPEKVLDTISRLLG